jgi:class 3 adenylate cyclase
MTVPEPRQCSQCGSVNPAGFKFCGNCGMSLAASAETILRPTAASATPAAAAERRQLTVMFCDLAGSTELSDRLDPEELREIIGDYQRMAGTVIDKFDGYIAQYLGDGLLVYFGFPKAHEDAPRRAVHAGLGILDVIKSMGAERDLRLGVRIGIHTGEVVTGEVGHGVSQEQLALGQTPNLAARLQAAADVDTVLISGTTHRLVQDFFACEPRGTQSLKGLSRPVETFRVLRDSGVRTQFERAAETGLAPLIGRDHELRLLQEAYGRAANGAPQVVVIEALPGIGKSRLLRALRDAVVTPSVAWWQAGCSPYASDTSFFPLIELVENAMGASRDASAGEKLAAAERWLDRYGLASPDSLALIGSLLSLTSQTGVLAGEVTPQREKAQIVELLRTAIAEAARDIPLVVAFEDLHWMDPSTLDFLRSLVVSPPPAKVLLILTSRPSFTAPWSRTSVTHLTLEHLLPEAAAALTRQVAGLTVPDAVVKQIIEKTDGVPLFVEELTRMVVESGQLQPDAGRYVLTAPLSSLQIPATLQDSLMARLDRLHDLKEVAQLASVLGREFSFELLAESYPDTPNLQSRLEGLVEAGLLFQEGSALPARFLFKHALLQDAAYGSLLKSKRRQHHERVAMALERKFPALIEVRPELAAHHFTEAHLPAPAIRYWQRAGEIALARSANIEAINHLNRALALLEELPPGLDRDRQELVLQTTLCPALNTTRGYASPDVERAFARAREICDAIGEVPELFWIIRAQWAFHIVRGELARTEDIGEQLLRIAIAKDSALMRYEAHYALATVKFWRADFTGSLSHFDRVLELGFLRDRTSLRYTGQHTGVLALAQLSWLRWVQGAPDDARRRSREAVDLANEISHPLSVTMALFFSIWVHQFLRERDVVRERASDVITRSREQGLFYELLGNLFIGWSMTADSIAGSPADTDAEEGIQLIRQCLDMNRASGARLAHTYYLSLLLDVYISRGKIAEGRQVLDEALATVAATGETFWLAELHRLAGELELTSAAEPSGLAAARASFREAQALAHEQGARALEDRAARSLAVFGAL